MPFGFKLIKNKRAQIVLPAILLIPTILLVIYLLFETAKLSREKIRHQFALDTSAFVELTSTSQYLNSTAYVNGAFPFRLFGENLDPTGKETMFGTRDNPDDKKLTLYDLFYQGGAFPAMEAYDSEPKDSDTEWELDFYDGPEAAGADGSNPRQGWNSATPPKVDDSKPYPIMSKKLADQYAIGWNPEAIKLYVLIYYFLSRIYEDQKTAYLKLVKGGEFFRKGYYLNTGDCKLSECGKQGSKIFKDYIAKTNPVYIKNIEFYFVNPDDNSDETKTITLNLEEEKMFEGKLFQYVYADKGYLNKLRKLYKGVDIEQPFTVPNNYFNVNLERYRPHNHVRVALQCTKEDNNCIWPNPTPKYQVRIFP